LSDFLLQRAQAAYPGLAVGNALGATVEFIPQEIRSIYYFSVEMIYLVNEERSVGE